ncbi:MAG TPA: peptidyl-tRNA hydrolase, partial [Planctomycetes bacterium]|nr:peptidyl-tRNA hydrolase [Planctomycetota bacterium]
GAAVEAIFVVCDDMNLPLGRIRIRSRGSHGGHKGLLSVGNSLRSWEFPRLRMGIGKPPPGEEVDFVLGRFLPEEEPLVEKMVDEAARAVSEYLQGEALENLMNKYNAG